ncbi:R.Pab1 family restriction endonuclease [Candidatus Saccharibacteria bacterium]|nr:R.Pab1 family restriction endonuclease [Candidatus Saccharibacteria bacterium]
MPQIELDNVHHKISVPIMLTAVSGKIRVKNRSVVNEYGAPVAVRRDGFKQSNYVEWQIGYDVVKKEVAKLAESTLPDTSFVGANGKEKALYELSEYIYYFYKWGVLVDRDLDSVAEYLGEVEGAKLISNNSELQIDRSQPIDKKIDEFDFEYTQVKYPLLIHRSGDSGIITEIKITEKQYAVGVQPMLYICFPITELRARATLVGRIAETKEIAYFDITRDNIQAFIEVLKLFGILSESHKHDVLEIIKTIKAQ